MTDDINTAMESVKIGLSLFTDAIGLVRKTQDMLPDSEDKAKIEQSLLEADKAAKLAEAQIAIALGYKLCKCIFPPQIMLSHGYKETGYSHIEEFIYPQCNRSSIPPPDKPINIPQTNRT